MSRFLGCVVCDVCEGLLFVPVTSLIDRVLVGTGRLFGLKTYLCGCISGNSFAYVCDGCRASSDRPGLSTDAVDNLPRGERKWR